MKQLSEKRRPKWWLLYALLPLAIALLWGDRQLILPAGIHQMAEIAIVLFVCGLMAVWVHANQSQILDENSSPTAFTIASGPSDGLDPDRGIVLRLPYAAPQDPFRQVEPDPRSARLN